MLLRETLAMRRMVSGFCFFHCVIILSSIGSLVCMVLEVPKGNLEFQGIPVILVTPAEGRVLRPYQIVWSCTEPFSYKSVEERLSTIPICCLLGLKFTEFTGAHDKASFPKASVSPRRPWAVSEPACGRGSMLSRIQAPPFVWLRGVSGRIAPATARRLVRTW